eukprot:6478444-Amphidinium_carterae.1
MGRSASCRAPGAFSGGPSIADEVARLNLASTFCILSSSTSLMAASSLALHSGTLRGAYSRLNTSVGAAGFSGSALISPGSSTNGAGSLGALLSGSLVLVFHGVARMDRNMSLSYRDPSGSLLTD